ncbi:MAG: ABC transporter permease [Candidatus Aminicenantes bacterium]|nr:ABC transporter permease [Candidatus Aminicenantes bacterium]
MWKNYLITAIRNLKKHKGHSIINIMGLAIGMAASLLIFLYVHYELSYDMFHSKADRIQRVLLLDKSMGVSNTYAGITFQAMGPEIPKDIPEVEESVRIMNRGRQPLKIGDRRIYTKDMALVDPSLFKIFDFKLLEGDPDTALEESFTTVLTREMATTLFGENEPMGSTFVWNEDVFRVTGILDDIPQPSHLQFDVLISLNFPVEEGSFGESLQNWGRISAPTYILLREGTDTSGLEDKLIGVLRKNGIEENFAVTNQPLTDIHLRSKNVVFDGNNRNKGEISNVYSLSAVAFFILLIAIFNFMNLSTARSHSRSKEVGMRKVVGARRGQLIGQFLGESILLCVCGLVIALGLVALALTYLKSAFDLHLDLGVLSHPPVAAGIFAGMLLTGLLAGIWPSFVLSSFRPTQVLKGGAKSGSKGMGMRRVLVVVQFAISIALIIGSGIVFQQIKFIKTRDMGYNREQILTFSFNQETGAQYDTLVEKLAQSPVILSLSSSANLPGRTMGRFGIKPDGIDQNDPWIVSGMTMDEYFIETLGLELIEGRNFSREFGTDEQEAVIINQAAAKAIGWAEPLNKTFQDGALKVVGVIRDFHFASLRHVVEPLVIRFRPGANGLLSLKLRAGAIPEGIAHLRAVWNELLPGHPLEFTFLDDEFDMQYHREQSFGSLTRGFTVLAIFIACLGLFGLASHTVEQRTKEIGIRKVLGAKVGSLVSLLAKTYLKLVLLANLIAWPAAYFLMKRWLADFVYRIDIGFGIFVISMIAAAFISLLTVSYHSLKAANKDPVRALRYE